MLSKTFLLSSPEWRSHIIPEEAKLSMLVWICSQRLRIIYDYYPDQLFEVLIPYFSFIRIKDNTGEVTHIEFPYGVRAIPSKFIRNFKTGEAIITIQKLKQIIFPDTTIFIAERFLNKCINATKIRLPKTITTIDCNFIKRSNYITSISIYNNDFPFHMKNGTVSIPNVMLSIGSMFANGCMLLTSVVLPDNITFIKDGSFSNCVNLTNIDLPQRLTKIGNDVLTNCMSLTTLSLPDTVETIGFNFARSCTLLRTVTLPYNLEMTRYGFLSNCESLQQINIPESLTLIRNCNYFRKMTCLPHFIHFFVSHGKSECNKTEQTI